MFQLERHYEMHSNQIYQFLYFLTFDVQLAEDLMQETFILAYEARNAYRGEANVLTWLRIIARNIAYDHFKRKRIISFTPFTKIDEGTPVTLSAEQLVSIEEEKRELYQAIAGLNLGWNEAKVKNNTERGMKTLEKMMKGGKEHGK